MCCCLYNLAVRILLLNLYYPPDTSATAKMAQTIVDALSAAHEVTVVCGRPSYEPTERRAWRLWRPGTSAPSLRSANVEIIPAGSADLLPTVMLPRTLHPLTAV